MGFSSLAEAFSIGDHVKDEKAAGFKHSTKRGGKQ